MNLLLVHGAWQGRWVWDAFLPHLAQAVFHCTAIDLPGNGSDATPAARFHSTSTSPM